jgi:hypothetical protein
MKTTIILLAALLLAPAHAATLAKMRTEMKHWREFTGDRDIHPREIKRRTAYAKSIRITDNCIQGGSTGCIQAFSVSGLDISDNKLSLSSAASATAVTLSLANTVNKTISGNSRQ